MWRHTLRRVGRPPDQRPDASVIVDEAHNALALPIDLDIALAESRGYRVSWMLAHQHLGQLPPHATTTLDSNARNKIIFTVSPRDARHLIGHFPGFDETDLSQRPAYQLCARTVAHGANQPPYTLDALPLPPPIPARADQLRAHTHTRAPLTTQRREHHHTHEITERARRSPLHEHTTNPHTRKGQPQ